MNVSPIHYKKWRNENEILCCLTKQYCPVTSLKYSYKLKNFSKSTLFKKKKNKKQTKKTYGCNLVEAGDFYFVSKPALVSFSFQTRFCDAASLPLHHNMALATTL